MGGLCCWGEIGGTCLLLCLFVWWVGWGGVIEENCLKNRWEGGGEGTSVVFVSLAL